MERTIYLEEYSQTFAITCEINEIDGNRIFFTVLSIKDEENRDMMAKHNIIALPSDFRTLDMEELCSLPKSKDVVDYFNSGAGQTRIVLALEDDLLGWDGDIYA